MWLQGEESAPPLIKACINSIRKHIPNRKIQIITESNYGNYVHLPEHILQKFREGKISYAHFSDLIRISLLCEFGGTWCDATVLCTSPPRFYVRFSLVCF